MSTCLVKDCSSKCTTNADLSGVTLHVFPTRMERIKQWLQQTGQFPNLNELAENILHANENNKYCLCSQHFSEDSYMVVGNHRQLKPDAVPSIFPTFRVQKVIMEDLQKPNFNYQRGEDNVPHCSCRCMLSRQDAETQTDASWFTSGNLSLSSVSPVENHKDSRRLDNNCYRPDNNPQVLLEDSLIPFLDPNYSKQGLGELMSCVSPALSKKTAKSEKYQEISSVDQSFPPQLDFTKRTLTIEKDDNHLTEEILRLALRIICLLTEEDYTVVKKTSGDCESPRCSHLISEGWSGTHSPILEPPARSLIHEKDNNHKILELTNKIIELLTGEVPVRCQDVAVYFSVEEWEYVEGHKDLYKEVMMENRSITTLQDGSSIGHAPDRCPSLLYSQECLEENISVQHDHEGEHMNSIKGEATEKQDTYLLDGQQTQNEEIPIGIQTSGERISGTISTRHIVCSPDNVIESTIIVEDSSRENLTTQAISPITDKGDLLPDSSNHMEYFPEASYITTQNLIAKNILTGSLSSKLSNNLKGFSDLSNIYSESTGHRGGKRFSCSTCGKYFTQKSNLIVHQRIHTREKPFSCLECGKCFSHKSNLVQHRRIHTGQRPHTCSECGKCFIKNTDLVKHQRTHGMVRPFPCSECGKCFTLKSDMVRHQRNHTGQRPFTCSQCGKCFSLKSDLGRHERIHSGYKPFSCSYCGKCFTLKSNLHTHQRIHTGEKPFSCPECDKSFTHKSNLVQHQRIHVGERHVTSPEYDGNQKRNTPERCPSLLYFQDGFEKNQNAPQDYQDESFLNIKVEDLDDEVDTFMMDDHHFMEMGHPTDISKDGSSNSNTPERSQSSSCCEDWPEEDDDAEETEDLVIVKVENTESDDEYTKSKAHVNEDFSTDVIQDGESSGKTSDFKTEDNEVEYPSCPPDYSNHGDVCSDTLKSDTIHSFFHCMECGKCFSQRINLMRHQKIHKGEKPFPCSMCGKCFTHKSDVVRHQRIHTGERPFPCFVCGKSFSQKSVLIQHQRIHNGEKPFSCNDCGRCFTQKSILIKHQKVHTDERPFFCHECGKCFTRKSVLLEHQRSHFSENPFPCFDCGQFFLEKANLEEHQVIHNSEKPFSCSQCDKYFKFKSDLVRHERIHTGEKPFSCVECGKCFSQKSDVVIHQRIHKGEKPFICIECGKSFTQKSVLLNHQIMHTGEKPFSCAECGKFFTRKSNLIKHQSMHTGVKPFSCSECGKSFTRRSRFLKHQENHRKPDES